MAKKAMTKGVFITFEGIEGCGKTTHVKLLYDYLKKESYDVIRTREPGGTELGEGVRKILLHSDGMKISDLAEVYLFEAARSQIVAQVIKPNLAKKKIVICDRFSDATLSYQGYGGKVPLRAIETLDSIATGGLKPDITILLDIDVVTGLKRAKSKGVDRMEKKAFAYHNRVRSGYLELAKKFPGRIKVVNVRGPVAETQQMVRKEVRLVIQRYKRPR
jgi:dTMP kinase